MLTCVILISPAAWAEGGPTAPAAVSYAPAVQLATLANAEIQESSGLAASRRSKNVFWTHNDSGDTARLFALNERGHDLGTVQVRGATAVDWEDIASFERDGRAWLLVGDVGDNQRRRATSTLYLLAEPAPSDTAVDVHQAIHFQYEGGPRDCEAVAVDPSGHTLWLVSKAALGADVFALEFPPAGAAEVLTAKRVARLAVPGVTGMDMTPDGRRAILVTYAAAFEFSRGEEESWPSAWQRAPSLIETPARRQGESICYGHDGRTLYLTSEKVPTPLWKIAPQIEEPTP